ncbi:SDR family NAD(P)-dependent oxidoreductase [Peribacillus frigoritolerans]|uniref:SDR family NAD(P)-dependent oxidoreductase n=1 Tax=Peribacillus frigoritolerans TaxID=450367 RepID=UPI0032E510FA
MAKTIFITGAGSGLGRGAALGLAKQGHRVIATTDITSQKTDLMREAQERGLDMEVFKLEIANERDRARIDNHDFDVFVANAAINEGGPLGEMPMDRFRAIFEVIICKLCMNCGQRKRNRENPYSYSLSPILLHDFLFF